MGNLISTVEQKEPRVSRSKPANYNSQHPKLKAIAFKIHIAIDFGTDGCGLAFTYNDKVTIYNKWRAQQTDTNSKVATTTKTKTQVILNENNGVTAFGNAAKFTYFNLSRQERERKQFFEKFKMALYEQHLSRSKDIIEADEEDEKRDDINTAQYLYSSNKKKVASKIVFIAVFKQLQEMAKRYIPQKITKETIKDEEIQWIVTVPAIWSEKAKNNMRKWIIAAGLVNENIIDQCVIVYEPDCASLSIQKQYFKDLTKNKKNSSKKSKQNVIFNPSDDLNEESDDEKEFKTSKEGATFEKNDKYILIDAGGGTVDIACHKILENGCVEEIVYPTGDKWGSTYIDELYVVLLKAIFSKEWINDYQQQEPAGFVEIVHNFQKAKESFYKDPKAITHRVRLPKDFVSFLAEQCEENSQDITTTIKQFAKSKQLKDFRALFSNKKKKNDDEKYNDEGDESKCSLKFVREQLDDDNKDEDDDESESDEDESEYVEYIEMDIKIWKCLFDSKINPIISHVEELLKIEALKDCKFLGLVGGFSCSKYFQYRMQQKFGESGYYQMTIVVPKKPMLSVVEGAALMAITEFNYIRKRTLKYTYGIQMECSKLYAKSLGIHDDYINYKENIAEDGSVKRFKVFVRKNERVAINEVKTHIGFNKSMRTIVPVLRSEKYDPKVASEGQQVAVLTLPCVEIGKEIVNEFHFGGTTFKVYAYPKSNPNAKQQVSIKYV